MTDDDVVGESDARAVAYLHLVLAEMRQLEARVAKLEEGMLTKAMLNLIHIFVIVVGILFILCR